MLRNDPLPCVIVPTIVRVIVCPGISENTLLDTTHCACVLVNHGIHPIVLDVYVTPAGRMSSRYTLLCVVPPLLVTVIVYVIVFPDCTVIFASVGLPVTCCFLSRTILAGAGGIQSNVAVSFA